MFVQQQLFIHCHLLSGMMLGQVGSLAPDFSKAQVAARWLYTIIESGKSKTAKQQTLKGSKESKETATELNLTPAMTGDIEFEDVTFAYPSRPDAVVFDHFSLHVPAGRTLALVGQSGCGKSTAIALLEKFYEPASGSIKVRKCLECGKG